MRDSGVRPQEDDPARRIVEPDRSMWQVGAELGVVAVAIDGGELAAYRLARMSARLMQGLAGAGGDPEVVWQALAASCTTDYVVSRTLTALGRSALLQGHHIEVRGVSRAQSLTPVVAPCTLAAALRVLGCSEQQPGCLDVRLAVSLGLSEGTAVVRFELELRLQRRVAA
jgi:hypothetical protein